ncbi:MAG: type II CRISPR-associated endonuclease Cas1 [Proteobacteria bacterium]|nr:type II CRISPR-associated endonuclease Cas1 [Pseudomonadota bacterium]
MIGRVVEIVSEGCHLSRARGLMTVTKDGEEQGRVPLDDIGVLLCNARGLTYSNGLLVELAQRNVPVVLCGTQYQPVAWLWPLEGHHVQAMRMRSQLESSLPLRKRMWQAIVRAKITGQRNVLDLLQLPIDGFDALARKVRSGDPENIEAQAARRYWPLLFGKSFRRGRHEGGPNDLLNYGYAVLRSSVARAIVSAGLHPSIGIHHSNQFNAMCLVDDLMEPFRPVVDYTVVRLVASGDDKVDTGTKQRLAEVLVQDMVTDRGTTPLQTCIDRAAQSLAQSYEAGKPDLTFPGKLLSGFIQQAP